MYFLLSKYELVIFLLKNPLKKTNVNFVSNFMHSLMAVIQKLLNNIQHSEPSFFT